MKQCCVIDQETTSTVYSVSLVGNPNTGKTQIFNHLTGLNQKIGNFPGITVGYKQGTITGQKVPITVVDLPGLYGFHTIRPEEESCVEYLQTHGQHLIVNVVDGTKLTRDLILTHQILKYYSRDQVILVINYADKMERRKIRIDIPKLKRKLGIEILLVSALRTLDNELLKNTIIHKLEKWIEPHELGILDEDNVIEQIEEDFLWVKDILEDSFTPGIDLHQIGYKVDKILLHPLWGMIIFVLTMFSVFYVTYAITQPISKLLENSIIFLGQQLTGKIGNQVVNSFINDWLISGIGFILIFIPQIAVLMFLLDVLEQSGYTSRIAFVMNKLLAKIGIEGTSIVPMLMGFGCNVPAIIGSKTISNRKERISVVLANPFLSCSARLPVYVLIASALFPKNAAYVVAGLYFGGILVAVSVIYALRKSFLKSEMKEILIEIPDLAIPSIKSVSISAAIHIKRFIINAATWMALGLLMIWVLSVTGPSGYTGMESGMEHSWIYIIGNIISPIFSPFGWSAELVVALIFGFVAKEIIVGVLGIIFATGGNLSALQITLQSVFTASSGLSFLVFVSLYTPCIGTYFAIKQELGSKWANTSVIISLGIAYFCSLLTYYIGGLVL